MVSKAHIEGTLLALDTKYQATTSGDEALWFAKLAIIELCGWIEESMDDLVRRCSTRHLKEAGNLRWCETDIIKKTYGFDYDQHFRMMLIRLMGLVAVEKLEKQLNPSIHAQMLAALTFLRPFRNTEAHTHLKSTTTLNAPSLTRSKFPPVYDGLVEFDRVIRRGLW